MDKKFDQFVDGSSSEADPSQMLGAQRSALQTSSAPKISSEPPLFQTITERYIAEVTSRSQDMEDRWNATKDKLHKADFINHDLKSKLMAAKRSARSSKFMFLISFFANGLLCALIFLLIRNGTLSVDLIKKTIEGLV
jgi:hypothetical protein